MLSKEKMRVTEYICDAIGLHARILVDERQQAIRLHLAPWSQKNTTPTLGELWRGQVVSKDPGGQGCIVDVGLVTPVYLQTKKETPTTGSYVDVKIKSERRWDKKAVAVLDTAGSKQGTPSKKSKLAAPASDPFLSGVEIIDSIENSEASVLVFEAIELALLSNFSLIGGGSIHIEITKALTAIDIDAGNRINKGNRSNFAFSINKLAIDQICTLLSLKSSGGLFVIDFLKMQSKQHIRDIQTELQNRLKQILGRKNHIGNMSQFGLIEASIAHTFSPVEFTIESIGDIEWTAINMFRDVESEAKWNNGRFLLCKVSTELNQWLKSPSFSWKSSLINRIGHRVEFIVDNNLSSLKYTIGVK